MIAHVRWTWLTALVAGGCLAACDARAARAAEEAAPPKVGENAKNFELPGIGDKTVELAKLSEAGPVVVVVLRGWPGYQCPACAKQFGDFTAKGKEFAALKATVVFIYPGPEAELAKRAEEFLHGEKLPAPFVMALDPGYKFTNLWGLRWNEPGETSRPSTFVLDPDGKVKFQKVSHTHGDRADVDEVLEALRK